MYLINLLTNIKIILLVFLIYKFLVDNIFVIKSIIIVSKNCKSLKNIKLSFLYNF